jgi:propanol-preferring alcohol dehydrogenase
MRAMLLDSPGKPLRPAELPTPTPGPGQLLIQVQACAVCRTDLHVVDGELPNPKLPLIPGHEIVGTVAAVRPGGSRVDSRGTALGPGATRFAVGDRVGVPWLGWICGQCHYCLTGRENLCDQARFTGYTLDGGYAQFTVADERFCIPIPDAAYPDPAEAAPLLCAGLIGYRALSKTGSAQRLGLYGFGAAAHLIAQVAVYQQRQVYAFTRPGDTHGQEFARSLGATWAGGSDSLPPVPLDAAIIFAPVGPLVPLALKALAKGAPLICAGIHMSDIPAFPYSLLWHERSIVSVANLTRRDADEFFALAPRVPVRATVQTFPLAQANEALAALRSGKLNGAAVLLP